MRAPTRAVAPGALDPPAARRRISAGISLFLAAALAALLAGCATAATPAATPTPVMSPPGQTPAAAVAPSAPTATVAPVAGADTMPEGGSAGMSLTLGEDSVARYLVREQLAGLSFPNDAVGETSDVAGVIVFDGHGRVDSARSSLTVDLASLRSDEARRDNFLRTRSLQTNTHPTARFEARQTHGLPWPLPTQGEHTFQIEGDMTVREVTRPLTWEVTARFEEESAWGGRAPVSPSMSSRLPNPA